MRGGVTGMGGEGSQVWGGRGHRFVGGGVTGLWGEGSQVCGGRGHRFVGGGVTGLWGEGSQVCGGRGHRFVGGGGKGSQLGVASLVPSLFLPPSKIRNLEIGCGTLPSTTCTKD